MPQPTARETSTPALTSYLDRQAQESHERLGDVAGVAVTLALEGTPYTVGASRQLARDVDEMQYVIGRGPCLHALTTGDGLYVPDLGADERWGDYGPRAAALGAACCLSLPIQVDDFPVGAFKIYSGTVDGLDVTQRALGLAIADQLTGGLGLAHLLAAQAEELDDRTAAMDQRRPIDLAIGVLMERHRCSPQEAFERLRRQSNDTNVKLRDTARVLLQSLGRGPVDRSAPFRSGNRRPG